MNRPMNLTSEPNVQGTSLSIDRDQAEASEVRLWERARFNLTLLYGGLRGTADFAQVILAGGTAGAIGGGKLEL
jgi:hypothetical protein